MRSSTYSREYAALRNWLKTKREEKGLSLREVGELVGRHHSVIGKMEQDRRKIDVVEFVEYCLALEIEPADGLRLIKDVVLARP